MVLISDGCWKVIGHNSILILDFPNCGFSHFIDLLSFVHYHKCLLCFLYIYLFSLISYQVSLFIDMVVF